MDKPTRPHDSRRGIFRRKPKPALITSAQVGPGQDRRRREREYFILQALRVPSLILGLVFLGLHWWIPAIIIIAITIPIPWVAVVLGNSKGEVRDERERNVYRPGLARQQQQLAERARLERARQAELDKPNNPTIEHED